MAVTNTANIALVKPTPGTKEPWSTSTYNANLDKVDAAIGPKAIKAVTSGPNNTATETQLHSVVLAAFSAVSTTTWRIVVWGTFDHSATSTTVTFRLKIGGVTLGTIAFTTPASALTGRAFRAEGEVTCMTTGAAGTWRACFNAQAIVNTTPTTGLSVPSAAVTRDTTVSNTLEITGQWGAANAANILRADGAYAQRVSNA